MQKSIVIRNNANVAFKNNSFVILSIRCQHDLLPSWQELPPIVSITDNSFFGIFILPNKVTMRRVLVIKLLDGLSQRYL